MDTTKEEVTSHDEEAPKGPEGPRGPEIPRGFNGPSGPSEDKVKEPDELRCRCGNPPRHSVSGWCMRCDFSFKER